MSDSSNLLTTKKELYLLRLPEYCTYSIVQLKWYRISIRGKSVGALTSPLTSVWYRHLTEDLDDVVPNYM
jgi:hypothetical protein